MIPPVRLGNHFWEEVLLMKNIKYRLLSFLIIFVISISPATAFPDTSDSAVKTVQAAHKKKAKVVYITKTGECYHTHKCGNGTYYKSTLKKQNLMDYVPVRNVIDYFFNAQKNSGNYCRCFLTYSFFSFLFSHN